MTAANLSPLLRLEAMTKQQQAKKLKLTLELIRQKRAQGLALTVAEAELLAECQRRYHSKPTETMTLDRATGAIHFKRTNDVEPLMRVMLEYGELIGGKRNDRVGGAKMVGAVDPITLTNWQKETGLRPGTKEFAQFAIKRINDDIDYRKFRVGH